MTDFIWTRPMGEGRLGAGLGSLTSAGEIPSAVTTLYVATTGSDGGAGTQADPYATVAKALSRIPVSVVKPYEIVVSAGTYSQAIDVSDFICTGAGRIQITGDPSTPANVSFSGTVTKTKTNDSTTSHAAVVFAEGKVNVEVEGIRVNATAGLAMWARRGARLTIDRCTLTGTLGRGVEAEEGSNLELHGNISVSGFTQNGVTARQGSEIFHTRAGTLAIAGPTGATNTATGINIVAGRWLTFSSNPSGVTISITSVKHGFQVSFNGNFTNQASGSSIILDNVTNPSDSTAILCTDGATWSSTGSLIIDHFRCAFEANSQSYIESSGVRAISAVTTTTLAGSGGTVLLL